MPTTTPSSTASSPPPDGSPPARSSLGLKLAIAASVVGMGLLGGRLLAVDPDLRSLGIAAVLALASVGLVLRMAWGRLLTGLFLWLAVLFVPFVLLNPLRLLDTGPGALEERPALLYGLSAALVVVPLLLLHLLGKHKREFRWRRRATARRDPGTGARAGDGRPAD